MIKQKINGTIFITYISKDNFRSLEFIDGYKFCTTTKDAA